MTILKTLVSFDGRITRRRFWAVLVCLVALAVGVQLFCAQLRRVNHSGELAAIFILVLWLFATVWVMLAISIKRLHDIGLSGGWLLVWLVPFLGGIGLLLVLGSCAGSAGRNKYGRDPRTGALSPGPPPAANPAPALDRRWMGRCK